MATTREYTDYLNDQVDIAPVNSQEELQAAELIESLFVQHGLETQVQEFDSPSLAGLSSRIYLILLFIGILLAGFIGTPVSIVGVVMVVVAFVLLALAHNGNDVLAAIGPQARSQNVIGVHRAEGPNVIKGARPIVIVAHYDTPRENFLNRRELAKWQPLIKRLNWPFSIAVLVLTLLQLIPFIPVIVRHAFWVLGVLTALPLLLLGAASIYERFAACTTGANDNKASVAAMLGVLDMVRPGPDDAKAWAASHPKGVRRELKVDEDEQDIYEEYLDDEYSDDDYDDEDDFERSAGVVASTEPVDEGYVPEDTFEAEDEYAPEDEYEDSDDEYGYEDAAELTDEYGLRSPSTVRRGADLLASMQVLPENCEIVYEGLIPREEAIERIEAANAAAAGPSGMERLRDVAGGLSENVGGGLSKAREFFAKIFAVIRDFFASLRDRFAREREVPEIERGESDIPSVTRSAAANADEDDAESEYADDEYFDDEEYDDEEYLDEEYDDEEYLDEEYDEYEEATGEADGTAEFEPDQPITQAAEPFVPATSLEAVDYADEIEATDVSEPIASFDVEVSDAFVAPAIVEPVIETVAEEAVSLEDTSVVIEEPIVDTSLDDTVAEPEQLQDDSVDEQVPVSLWTPPAEDEFSDEELIEAEQPTSEISLDEVRAAAENAAIEAEQAAEAEAEQAEEPEPVLEVEAVPAGVAEQEPELVFEPEAVPELEPEPELEAVEVPEDQPEPIEVIEDSFVEEPLTESLEDVPIEERSF
ncbi:MAG: hypothetical protein II128_03630, partial [Atopobiaceae bacterium]|nr:hypothetical protein [Atopobiaceae bacterium]